MILLRPDKTFSRDVCVQCAYAASWAYRSENEIMRSAPKIGADRCKFIEDTGTSGSHSTDTQLFVVGDKLSLLVAFRGTSNLRDWITDCESGQIAWNWPRTSAEAKERVHHGFHFSLNSIWHELNATICRLRDRNQYVHFTGHSLGGALAMLAAQRWTEEGNACGLYTFGQPRCWNSAGAQMFDRIAGQYSFRIVHAQDVVARVPWLLGRYRHAGHEIFFDAWDKLRIDLPWYWKLPSDAYGNWREWTQGKIALLADHSMDRYLELVQGNGAPATGNKGTR